jgi:hypothetical protein
MYLIASVALLSQLMGAASQSCPFAPKVTRDELPEPRCTANKTNVKELQPLFDDYCAFYGFKDNGVGPNDTCITVQDQHVEGLQELCATSVDPSCMGPLQVSAQENIMLIT